MSTVTSTAVVASAVVASDVDVKAVIKPKRKYTARGTTVVARRVTLLDGKVIGRGKPAKATKSARTVVYVPMDQEYNPAVHGLGVKFTPGLVQFRKVFKRIKINDLGKVYNLSAIVETVTKSQAVDAPTVTETVSDAVLAIA
jgi:hypothetical protein